MDTAIIKSPLVSVVIPTYNKSSYLIEMLKAIKAQTYSNWELLIVDDGSDEIEYEKVNEFVSDDERIKLMKRNREPKNGDTCRNIGMEQARGKYIIIFDADDLVSKTCFENRVRFMEGHPEFDYVSFPSASFIEGTNDIKKNNYNTTNNDILGNLLTAKYPFTVWANIYKKSALEGIRWDEKVYLYQDFDFMVQCILKGLKHGWTDNTEPDYFYRVFVKGESVCSNVVTKQKTISTNYLFEKTVNQLSKYKDSKRNMSLFLTFVVLYYERLLRDNNNFYIEAFLSVIDRIYPSESDKFRAIYTKRQQSKNHHYSLFLMYKRMYSYYKIPMHKSFALHEVAKTLLLRK